MKTIEERAKEYARIAQNCEKCREDECLQENFRCDHFRRVYYAFINGAKAQKKIDIDKIVHLAKVEFCRNCGCGIPRDTCTSLGTCNEHDAFAEAFRKQLGGIGYEKV